MRPKTPLAVENGVGKLAAKERCPKCGGTGYVAKPVDMNGKSEGVAFIHLKCPACGGSGRKPSTLPTTVG
jgi:DnaJ-class molecular chaperone